MLTQTRESMAINKFGYGYRPKMQFPKNLDHVAFDLITTAKKQPLLSQAYATSLHRAPYRFRKGTSEREAALDFHYEARRSFLREMIADAVEGNIGFGDRSWLFWLDHFTARWGNSDTYPMYVSYAHEAIRSNVHANFFRMLSAAVLHPTMICYLNQDESSGPNSPYAIRMRKEKKTAGLNENLAREILELHTLGSAGPYTQKDVTQFALLLTGVHYNYGAGMHFNPERAEPGVKVVLGKRYGKINAPHTLDDVRRCLHDLSMRPETGRHICKKLVQHFISDNGDRVLEAAMFKRWTETKGSLYEVSRVMVHHPNSYKYWQAKVKRPVDYVLSSLRALGLTRKELTEMPNWKINEHVIKPMKEMGQDFLNPPGPNGFPEQASAWIKPATYVARVRWAFKHAMQMTSLKGYVTSFPDVALNAMADNQVKTNALRASNTKEAVAIVLASNKFNRR